MEARPSSEIDDELFDEVYGKEYTGPPGSTTHAQEGTKKIQGNGDATYDSEDDDTLNDPNAVPTDFTSREAKAWVAKAKATERNWKKRKEEEMICKLCGESGHFTQGCPSTLGANRRSSEFFQRVAARDKHIRALFTEKMINRIERENDCKLKVDEKFIIVSSKNQSSMTKGVDAVHQVIKDNESKTTSNYGRSRSPNGSPTDMQHKHSDSHKPLSSPKRTGHFKSSREHNFAEDQTREHFRKIPRRSPQAHYDGGRGQSSRLKSPTRNSLPGDYGPFDNNSQKVGTSKSDMWEIEKHRADHDSTNKLDFSLEKSYEEFEMGFREQVMELGRIRNKEEDEENNRHRQVMCDLRESYTKKLALLRSMRAKLWNDFIQCDIQRRQPSQQQTLSMSTYSPYSHSHYPEYDRSVSSNPHFAGSSVLDARGRFLYPVDSYPNSRMPSDSSEFQHQRHNFGKPFHRY